MDKLFDAIYTFGYEMVRFLEDLEDNFGAPDLDEKLQYFRNGIQEFYDSADGKVDTSEENQDQANSVRYSIQLDCQKALERLSTINADSNTFDVIDVLKFASNVIVRSLPGQDLNFEDLYDPDDAMEAERISKMLTTPYEDEWD